MKLTFATVCTGIGAVDVAFRRQGYRHLWMCEIEKACRTILRKQFPGVPIHEDMVTLDTSTVERPDVLAGGTPCQGFSIAGERLSLEDHRSNLCLRFVQIANELDPGFILWENVPGCLSTEDNSFGCFLAALAGLDTPLVHPGNHNFDRFRRQDENGQWFPVWPRAGMVVGPLRTVTWRVIDSQYLGVAQRRERVFVFANPHTRARSVGNEGVQDEGGFYGLATKVLFESEVLRRHSPPSREKREDLAATLGASPEGSGWRSDPERMTFVPTVAPPLGAHALSKGRGTDLDNTTYVATHDVSPALQERGYKRADSDCIQAHVIVAPMVFDETQITNKDNRSQPAPGNPSHPLTKSGRPPTAVLGFDKGRGEYTGEEIAGTLRCNDGKSEGVNAGKPDNQCVAFQPGNLTDGRGSPPVTEATPTLKAENDGDTRQCVAQETPFFVHSNNSNAMVKDGPGKAGDSAEVDRALDTNGGFAEGQGGNLVVNPKRYQVRRLTPVECERLQAFPEVDQTVTIELCSGHPKNHVVAEHQNLKSLNAAGNAERNGCEGNAAFVKNLSSSSVPCESKHAPADVRISLGEYAFRIYRGNELFSFASIAEKENGFILPVSNVDFARICAGVLTTVERIIPTGAEESRVSEQLSLHRVNGRWLVRLYGDETTPHAKNVSGGTTTKAKHSRSTTLDPSDIKDSGSRFQTSCFSVVNVMTGLIPKRTGSDCLLRVEIHRRTSWTFSGVNDAGKEIEQKDSPRYRQLGNAWTTFVADWLAIRIKKFGYKL